MAKRDEKHLRMDGDQLRCMNCGERHKMAIPAPVWLFTATLDGWRKEHKDCRPDPEVAKRDAAEIAAAFKDAHAWLAGPDTGLSSKTIWHVMMGTYCAHPSVPLDPSDFGRCYRLLKAFPDWRGRLGEVAKKHPEWQALVENWVGLEALFEQESPSGKAPRLYARMQALRGGR